MNDTLAKSSVQTTLLVAAMMLASGCSVKGDAAPQQSAPIEEADVYDLPPPDNNDPFEPFNRGVFRFNEVVDGIVLKPAAHIYLGVVPTPVRDSVSNALTNLSAPVVFINSTLQGDRDNMGRTFSRFLINSTIGIAGLFDVASDLGIKKEHKKDFGQTFGVWGIGSGPYIQLPFFGASNPRDALGMIADTASDPFTYIFTRPTTITLSAIRVVDRRADLLPYTDKLYRDSLDPYASVRSVHQQYREQVITNYLTTDTAEVERGKKK